MMKKIIGTIVLAVAVMACNNLPSTGNFGAAITEDGAIDAAELKTQMAGKDELKTKVKGTVTKVCQSEGCWYKIDLGESESMTIFTKDHGFKLPKDCAGKTAIAEGTARWKEVSVEKRKHLAEDEGLKPEEIAKITEPRKELIFEAEGVIIK